MADLEAVDSEAAHDQKRLREDEEQELAEKNSEKKLRPSEGSEGAEEEMPSLDAAHEEKMEESAAEVGPGAEGKAMAGQEEVNAEPTEQDTVEAKPNADKEAEVEVELEVEAPASSGEDKASGHPTEVKIGPKVFCLSLDMFNYFYELLRDWPLNLNLNKYEHLMLVDLINQGHSEPEKKKGAGIEAFQVRINPDFYSRCFYIVRTDGSAEDFSYRKCVDNILPLPEEFKARSGDLGLGNKNKRGGGYRGHHHNDHGRGDRRGGGGRGARRGGEHWRGNRGRRGRF